MAKEQKNGKTYRIKGSLVKKAKNKHIEYIVTKKEALDEAEMINALIFKGLETITIADVDKYLALREAKEL